MKFFLTGKPGTGKSTIFSEIVKKLTTSGKCVGGISTPEIREGTIRTGFFVQDIQTGKKIPLARRDMNTGFKVGSYSVDVEGFEKFAIPILEKALSNCDMIAIDEIGKMEMLSNGFKEAVMKILNSEKPVLAIVGEPFVDIVENVGEVIVVQEKNQDDIVFRVMRKILE